MEQPRWRATILYRHDSGIVGSRHDLVEIGDLEGKVESGPDWRSIVSIEIVAHPDYAAAVPRVTVEQAMAE